MKGNSLRSCPVCGSAHASQLHKHNFVLFEGHPLAGECVTVACECCGLVFNGTTHSLETYERYYTELSKYASPPSPLLNMGKFSQVADVFMEIFPNKNAAILDIGCGGGGFLAALGERGYVNLSGMDPTPACVDATKLKLGIDCRVGALSAPPFPAGAFDVVVSTGVLEHLLLPARDLASFRELLKPSGSAFVVVPDAARYHDFMDAPFQDFNVEHINHFSPQTLLSLFEINGWLPIQINKLVLENTPTWQEPSVCGSFRISKEIEQSPEKDVSLKQHIQSYIESSSSKLKCIDSKLVNELWEENELVIWGAGQTTSILLGQTVLNKKIIKAVIDRNPAYSGRAYGTIPVGGPEILGQYSGPILVTTIREQDSVIATIREKLGMKNRLITLNP